MSRDPIIEILDLARWTPSGDNTQPWRFEVLAEDRIAIHGFDTRDHVLYDFEGHASHMAHGALLETLRIAALEFGYSTKWSITSRLGDRNPVYEVLFASSSKLESDPLAPFIKSRVVQRRVMQTIPLNEMQRAALLAAPGDSYRIQFFESLGERKKVARLLWDSAYIRLTCQEAFPVHQEIIEWGARYSKDRIPEKAVGVDPMTACLMKWVMQNWQRVDFVNRYLMGTVVPRFQLDVLPALFCAAHILVYPPKSPSTLVDWVNLGVAMQRIWLTVAQQGLHLQPEMTPLIFRWYARSGQRFSKEESLFTRAIKLGDDFDQLAGARADQAFGFFGRIGVSSTPDSRSIRHDLDFLMK